MFNAFYLFPKVISKDILSTPWNSQTIYKKRNKTTLPATQNVSLWVLMMKTSSYFCFFHALPPASVSIRSSAKSDSSFLFVARTRFIPRNWVAFLLHNVFGVSGIRTGVALGLPWSDWLNVSTLIQSQSKKGLINFSTLECINMIIRNRTVLEHSPVTRCIQC